MLRTPWKCTKNYNARAQLLFCSLNLLFGAVLVAVVVVVCLSVFGMSRQPVNLSSRMFSKLPSCVNGWESLYPFSVNAYESEYSKIDESRNIYDSGKISSSVNLV